MSSDAKRSGAPLAPTLVGGACLSYSLAALTAAAGALLLATLSYALLAPQRAPAALVPHQPAPGSGAALLRACSALRGRGVQHYAAMPGARLVRAAAARHEEDRSCGVEARRLGGNGSAVAEVVHCCKVDWRYKGLAGNILTQYVAGRFFAEVNSCAMPDAAFTGDNSPRNELGTQGVSAARLPLQWPPAAGYSPTMGAQTLEHAHAAYGMHRVPASYDMSFEVYPEVANWLYSALSLGWDLAGDTLLGRGVRGLNQVLVSGNATAERGGRWAQHREACALAGVRLHEEALQGASGSASAGASSAMDAAVAAVLEGLHPWLPSQLVAEVENLLRERGERGGGALPAGLRDLVRSPERTMVIHIRGGDHYRAALHDAMARGAAGITPTGGAFDADWLGPLLLLSGAIEPPGDSEAHLEMLEANAARAGALVIPPLSYFQGVLRGTRAAWDSVLVVGDASLAGGPLLAALVREFNATLAAGSVASDLAALLLARQLVVAGASTFSFMAAAMGRARVIHAPHAALLSARTWTGTCLLTPAQFDARWVFHDAFRGAVRRVAAGYAAQAAAAAREGLAAEAAVSSEWALRASGGAWRARAEFWRQPQLYQAPAWSSACPGDDAAGSGRGLARALGGAAAAAAPDPSAGGWGAESAAEAAAAAADLAAGGNLSVPLGFLTYRQVVGYYRNPACSRYFYPGYARNYREQGWEIGEQQWHTCVDLAQLAPLYDGQGKGNGCMMWGRFWSLCEG